MNSCFVDDLGPMAFVLAQSRHVTVRSTLDEVEQLRLVQPVMGALQRAVYIGWRHVGVPGFRELTGVEKTALLAASAWGVWFIGPKKVQKTVGTVCSKLVPGFKSLRAWYTGRPSIVKEKTDVFIERNQKVSLESRREGSVETAMTSPACQGKVGFCRGGEFVVIGGCVRVKDDYIIGPDHVLCKEDEDKYLLGAKGKMIPLTGERLPLATDAVAIKMSPDQLSLAGLRTAAFTAVTPGQRKYCSIVGPFGKGTTGAVCEDTDSFGRLVYYGTTVDGYSGCLYTAGQGGVIGIHTSGGRINGGYSLQYLWICLQATLKVRPESSEDWLANQFREGDQAMIEATGDPDTYQVRDRSGIYHNVDRELCIKVWGDDFLVKARSGQMRKRRNPNYEDTILESAKPESGNEKAAHQKSSGSGGPVTSEELESRLKALGMTESRKFSKTALLKILNLQQQ